jgi:hypothetical protein
MHPDNRSVPEQRGVGVTDYASTARMANDILSIGSDTSPTVGPQPARTAQAAPPPPPPSASPSVVSASAGVNVIPPAGSPGSSAVRPRPVPEAPLPIPQFSEQPTLVDGAVSPDFFTTSRPKKRSRWGR